jgi:O-antigen/teichoic acid export membrane protein
VLRIGSRSQRLLRRATGGDASVMFRDVSRRIGFAGGSAAFVVVSVVVNVLTLLRSYVAMRVLDYAELGFLAVLQTVILLVGLLQLGVINGGYRLFCSVEPAERARINNLVWSVIAALAVVSVLLGLIAIPDAPGSTYRVAILLGIVAGILTLLRTWMSNQLIATVRLGRLNEVNALSMGISMLPLLFVGTEAFLVCALTIVAQPLLFVMMLLWREADMRPAALYWSAPLLRRVLAAGFIVFLAGVFLLLNAQVERWMIVTLMGVEALGHFYLALLFVTLYGLVPGSLDAIFLPRLVAAHGSGDHVLLRSELRRFMFVTLAYTFAVVATVLLLARPLLAWLLPRYLPDLDFVFLLLPGIAAFGLVAPLAIVFNVLIQYRFYFFACASGTVVTFGVLAGYVGVHGTLDLTTVAIVKSLTYGVMAGLVVTGYLRGTAAHRELRFL